MKRIIAYLSFLLLFGCADETVRMEENFNVIIEEYDLSDKIELNPGKLTRYYNKGKKEIEIEFDSTEIKTIFERIRKNDLLNLPNHFEPIPEITGLPSEPTKIIITNGNKTIQITLYLSNSNYGIVDQYRVSKVERSIRQIDKIVYAKEAVKRLPRSDIVLF